MLKSCIITTEGINLRRGYVLKEMSIYLLHLNETKHYFFKSPININMDSNDMKTNWYTKKYLSGIGVNDFRSGSLENFSYMDILRSLSDHRIYVVGQQTYELCYGIIPHANIIDLQHSSFIYPKQIQSALCGFSHSNPRYCSLAKIWVIKNYLDENQLEM